MFNNKSKKAMALVDQHYDYVSECFKNFEIFMNDFLTCGSNTQTSEEFRKIDDLEGLADATRRAVIDAFLDGALLPTTRKEILQIVAAVDRIANKCQDIAKQLIYENVVIPEFMQGGISEILQITRDQMAALSTALEVLFSDFSLLTKDKSILGKVKDAEGAVDAVELSLLKTIFASDLSLAEKNQIKYFLSKIAHISDILEDISDDIQIMAVLRQV